MILTIEVILILTNEEKIKAKSFLNEVHACVQTGDFKIEQNTKNKRFERNYPTSPEDKKHMLLSLTEENCVKVDKNNNPSYEDAEVFVFIKKFTICVYGEDMPVEMYIKMYIMSLAHYNKVIVISFHEEGDYR